MRLTLVDAGTFMARISQMGPRHTRRIDLDDGAIILDRMHGPLKPVVASSVYSSTDGLVTSLKDGTLKVEADVIPGMREAQSFYVLEEVEDGS